MIEDPKSGLLIPDSLVQKREVWLKEDMKKLRRAADVAVSHRVVIQIRCMECKKLLEFGERDGEFEMLCNCKRRVVA